jgi:two-component system, chemotaxis family, chemotaxis protein CheY
MQRGAMKQRVLIVDDVEDIRMMLRYIIEKQDYVIVAEATNGIEAVEMYREHHPDITVMDIDMPYMSGVDAAREIRAITGDAKIILCSGGMTNAGQGSSGEIDGNRFIPKPFVPAQLYNALSL